MGGSSGLSATAIPPEAAIVKETRKLTEQGLLSEGDAADLNLALAFHGGTEVAAADGETYLSFDEVRIPCDSGKALPGDHHITARQIGFGKPYETVQVPVEQS